MGDLLVDSVDDVVQELSGQARANHDNTATQCLPRPREQVDRTEPSSLASP
jgi:hypothetical protein